MSASFIVLLLFKKNNVNKVLPKLQPIVLAITSLIGYFFMNEKLNSKEIYGIIFIILGCYLLK